MKAAQRAPLVFNSGGVPTDLTGARIVVTDGGDWAGNIDFGSVGAVNFTGDSLTRVFGGGMGLGGVAFSVAALTTVTANNGAGASLSIDSNKGTIPSVTSVNGGDVWTPDGGSSFNSGADATYGIGGSTATLVIPGALSLSGGNSFGESSGSFGGNAHFNVSGSNVLTTLTFTGGVSCSQTDSGGIPDQGGYVQLNLSGNTALTSIVFNSFSIAPASSCPNTPTFNLNASGCALTSACIDDIMTLFLATATANPTGFGIVDISGGTSATPSVGALANMAAMQAFNPLWAFTNN